MFDPVKRRSLCMEDAEKILKMISEIEEGELKKLWKTKSELKILFVASLIQNKQFFECSSNKEENLKWIEDILKEATTDCNHLGTIVTEINNKLKLIRKGEFI